jgi:uncharacterized protein
MKKCPVICLFFAIILCNSIFLARSDTGSLPRPEREQALITAAQQHDTPAILAMLKQGVNPNTQFDYLYLGFLEPRKYDDQPQLATVKLLLDHGANVNAHDNFGATPLIRASCFHDAEIVKILLRRGAHVDSRDKQKSTALLVACEDASSAPPHNTTQQLDTVNLLLEANANVNATDQKGVSPLMRAAGLGNIPLALLLLRNGADLNVRDQKGNTALKWATESKHIQMVNLLRQRGAKE